MGNATKLIMVSVLWINETQKFEKFNYILSQKIARIGKYVYFWYCK